MTLSKGFVRAAVIGAAMTIAGATSADDTHDDGKPHAHGAEKTHFSVTPPATVKEAWGLLTTKVAAAQTAITSSDLAGAHEAGEHIEAAVHTLQEKSEMVAAEKKTKLASALKQLDKAADELHHGAEDKDADASQAAVTKINGLIPLVEGLYPPGALQ